MIPNYSEVKQRENPLEPVVRKIEQKGWDAERSFKVLDEDDDGVLTKNEIVDGLKFHKVQLLDTEWDLLIKEIDKNGDGVLTVEEW